MLYKTQIKVYKRNMFSTSKKLYYSMLYRKKANIYDPVNLLKNLKTMKRITQNFTVLYLLMMTMGIVAGCVQPATSGLEERENTRAWGRLLANPNYFIDKCKSREIYTPFATNIDDSGKRKGCKDHVISSYHVSCDSYRPKDLFADDKAEALGGVVLYLYDDKEDWTLNDKHCKTGYIIIKRLKDIDHIKSTKGVIHGKVYKSVFGVEPDETKVVGSGFSYDIEESWRFNSFLFNEGSDGYHDNKKRMGNTERRWVMKALTNWIDKGEATTKVEGKNPLILRKR